MQENDELPWIACDKTSRPVKKRSSNMLDQAIEIVNIDQNCKLKLPQVTPMESENSENDCLSPHT